MPAPAPKQNIGQRIRTWLLDLLKFLGIDLIADEQQKTIQDWRQARTVDELKRAGRNHPGLAPGVLAARARELGASTADIVDMLRPELSTLLDDPSSFIGGLLQDAAASPMMAELNEVLGAVVFDPYFAELTGGKIDPHAPEVEAVRRLLGVGRPYTILGSLLSTLGGLASVGTVSAAGDFLTQAGAILGTPYTAARIITPIVDRVIFDPLERLANETFRPADFTRAQWMDLVALGKINYSRLGRELARLGYDNEKIQWLIDLAEKQPGRSDLLTLRKAGIIGDSLLAEGLRREGYGQEWIDRFMRLYAKEETTDEKGAYLSTLRKAYTEGLINEAQFREELRKTGRSESAINLEVAVLRLTDDVEAKTAAKSDIRSAYMADTIGRPEAEKWLADAGFTLDTIKLLLNTWDKQKQPTYKQINKAEILKAWGVGVLNQVETYQALINVGYDQRGATVLMDTYSKTVLATKPPDEYMLSRSDVLQAWQAEVLSDDEVIARLTKLGISEEDAHIIFTTYKRLHPRMVAKQPKELAKNDVLSAWGRGVLTEDVTKEKLILIGYSEEDAITLIESYRQRPAALPKEPTVSELIAATRRGVITAAVLSQKLTALGLPEQSVEFYVSYAVHPLPEITRQLTKADITKLWEQGRHDRGWALERLLSLNYSPEDAEDLLWLARPEIADTETWLLWNGGFIPDEVAIAMWSGMGFTSEQITEAMAGG